MSLNCWRRATGARLEVAAEHQVRNLAFPAISTGVYGYPADLAAQVAYQAVVATISRLPSIEGVIFCCFSAANLAIYQKLLQSKQT
jgi:O-acetyl-ADP-ribose deacetylase (regulator of RNase III)